MKVAIHSIILTVAVLAVIGFGQKATAQITKDTTHYNDEDLYVDTAPAAYFAVGGGVIGGLFWPNLDKFNQNIAQPFTSQDMKNQTFMIGGAGFIAVPWVKNLRVGGMGMSGHAQVCCFNTSVDGNDVARLLEYQIGYGALTIDYVLPLKVKKFHIVPGVALGLGSVNIFMRQDANLDAFDIQKQYNQRSPYVAHTYTSGFFLYMPQIQFEYNLTGFMMARLAFAYQGTAMGTWHVDRDININNQNTFSGINGNGFTGTLGLFFGLFQ